MIKAMKRRFMWVSMSSFTLVLFTLLVVLNLFYAWQSYDHIDHLATTLAQEQLARYNRDDGVEASDQANLTTTDTLKAEGPFSDEGPEVPSVPVEGDSQVPQPKGWLDFGQLQRMDPYANRFVSVFLDDNQKIEAVDVSQVYGLTETVAKQMAIEDLSSGKERGWHGTYRYYYYQDQTGRCMVYVDASQMLQTISRLVISSGLIFVLSLSLVYVVLRFLSRRAIQPLLDNIQKQREFISNASHEIKTPLAVLSTNNDVLEMTGQKNEWTLSNHRQIQRLNGLVEQMLLLARFDEGRLNLTIQPQDLVPTIETLAADVNALAIEQGKRLELQLPPTIIEPVDMNSFHQLLTALIENAIKYHVGDQAIQINWHPEKRILSVVNECEPMTQDECNQLFDRFYRRDSARNREQGGSGMGLSIARSLAIANQLELNAVLVKPNQISFDLQFKKRHALKHT